MKTKRYLTITLLAGLLLALLLTTACGPFLVTRNGEKFSGASETRQFDYADFTRVDISTAFDYEIIRADTYGISITAYASAFENIQVTKQGQTLKIGPRRGSAGWAFGNLNLKAVITMPRLSGLEGSGATRGTVSNFNSGDDLRIDLSGASTVDLVGITAGDVTIDASGASDISGDLTAANTDFELSGASKIQLSGSAQDAVIDASGASRLKLAGFRINNANIELSGASDADVFVNGTMDVDLSGTSDLDYSGQPSLGRTDISGGSSLKRD
jgi:hypothetical protein